MAITRKPFAILAAAALAVSLAGCGGDDGDDPGEGPNTGAAEAGGTLFYVSGPRLVEHWDPQRMYIGRDLSNANRLFYRGLTTFPVTDDAEEGTTPVADLATDTGTSSDGAATWEFTLKDGVKWEDGQPVTCADLKYGLSRGFATDVITGGPNYILGYLDVPKDPATGLPAYNGPYKNDNAADFDKAVECSADDKTITYHFNKPWPDFPLAIASLRFADPYRKDKDKGNGSNYQIFSNGPYKLEGTWNSGKGGTWVRNDQWDASTDEVRTPNPDKIVFSEGDEDEVVYERLFADSGDDQYAVTDRRVPPSFYSRLSDPAIEARYTQVQSPYVDYVLPNFNSPVFKDVKVRKALAASTDKTAWINAGGGERAYVPAYSIVSPDVPGYQPNPAFKDIPDSGDPEASKALLEEAGVKMPVAIKFTYSGGTPTSDKQAAALKAGWEKGGFKVELDPLTDTYYDIVQKPDADFDVTWGGWGADWPSIATVIPPLFDSRINLTENSNGQDYGNYDNDEINAMIDEAANAADVDEAAAKYAEIDAAMGEDVAYIPLEITVFNFLRGSKVTGYINGIATSTYPDLGSIAVEQ
jgi:peptide/nickel transport system substrate-binding protein